MARAIITNFHGYTVQLDASGSATRSGTQVTVRIPWEVYGTGYDVDAYINGDRVYWKHAGDERHDASGTKTIGPFTNYAGGTLSYPIKLWLEVAGGDDTSDSDTVTITGVPAAQFTVTFNANGGNTPSMASKSVTYGGTYGTLATCTRTGYTFDGWYTAASGGTKITSASTVSITANQTLYAHWTANSYTGTFDLQGGKIGGSGENQTKTETFDSAWVFPADPTRAGYTFAGWYTSVSGGTQVTGETIYSTAGPQTLYARWTGNTVTCTYDARGGTVSPASKDVTVGGAYGELPTPVRAGYSFLGWFTTVNGTTQLTDTSAVTATGNHTIYAHWEVQAILRIVEDGTVTATAAIYAVEGGTVRQIVGVYEVEDGVVHQGV